MGFFKSPQRLFQLLAVGTAATAQLSGSGADVPADQGPGGTAPVRPFRLDQVTLGDGVFQEKRDLLKNFLSNYDERRFLILFNEQAGRPNPDDLPVPGGWENGGLLSGHWAGHFMTALAQAYADQGEEIYKEKLDWMVKELAACQEAITGRMGNDGPGGEQPDEDNEIGRVEGKFGNALRLDGDSPAHYVTLPQETINQIDDFTFALWVNLASEQTDAHLFDFGHDGQINMYLTPRADSETNAPRFAITVGGPEEEQVINAESELPLDEWVHLAVTLGGGVGTLYVNGEVAGENSDITLSASDLDNPGNRWLGRSQVDEGFLNAAIDEFHVFDTPLSAEDIQSLQESADGTTGGGTIAWYRFDEDTGSTLEDSSPNGRDAGVVGGDGTGNDDWIPIHPGYLGAYPEEVVLRLGPPTWAVYGGDPDQNTWAPWYTQHKILRGLLDAYYLTNNTQALDVVTKMADWASLALTIGYKSHPDYQGNLTRDDLNYMWDLYIAGEFGGANEVFPEIYQLTGDEKHLETAKAFDNRESLFDASVEDNDILVVEPDEIPGRRRPQRLHANTHVPQFIGYLSVYEHSHDQEYFDAAKNFFSWVVPGRWFSSGGTGGNYPGSNDNTELFQNRDNVANAIHDNGAESCTSYNMIKLARNLFFHEHNATYMDNYERGLFNMIMGSRSDQSSDSDPLLTYFQPLTPGSRRTYGNTGTCCGGTGLESHTKYQETVYFRSADGSALWVNLFIPSTLSWEEKGFEVKQETDFPRDDTSKITVNGDGPLDIKLRVPAWVQKGFHVTINGEADDSVPEAEPGSYMTISRDWTSGDVIDISMPLTMRVERAHDRPDTQSLMWGPVLLQLLGTPGGDSGYHELSLYRNLKLDGDYSRAAVVHSDTNPNGDKLFSTPDDVVARPYYISDGSAVSSYFRRVEPVVVFGSVDTEVPNRKRNDGLPKYDVPVEGVESPGDDGPTFLDVVWDEAPFSSHEAFVDRVTEVADSFVEQGVYDADERDTIVEKAEEAKRALDPGCVSRRRKL